MGKRKERRLAALNNAGRRVKLDLFAEPSGDLDGSDAQEEVGGDIDSRQKINLPKSTSSSGHDSVDVLLTDHDDEVTPALVERCEDTDVNAGEDLTAKKVVQEETERGSVLSSENLEGRDEVKTSANASGYTSKESDLVQTSVPGTTNVQVVGDVSSGWKIVMHEESNNYYYWNIETGETSWEVPVVLAQATQSISDIKTSLSQDPENVTVYKQESSLTTGGKLDAFSAESTGYKNGVPVCASQGSEVEQSYTAFSTCSSDHMTKAGSENYVDYTVANDELKPGSDLPSQLVNWSEILLERLKSLQKSGGYEWMSEYIMEIQIRLSDYKSLSSFKTSLLPFWEHSKWKLKQIEDVMNKGTYLTSMSSQLDEAKLADTSSIVRKDNFQERLNGESEVERVENSLSTMEHSHLPADSSSLTVHSDIGQVTPIENVENISSSEAVKLLENGTGVIEHGRQTAIEDEMASKNGIHSVEDVDMEVDMELEDANSAGNLIVASTQAMSVMKSFASMEQPLPLDPPFQQNPFSGYAAFVPEDVSAAPPPPDDEWIPPPPPDNDEVPPPPPPDEPAEPLYPLPSTYTQLGQPLCYTEPYQFTYPDSNIKYYGQSVPEVNSANFYGHPEACNVAMAQAQFYYQAVPNFHTASASIIVNAVVPEGYGIVQDATPSLPVMSTAESSHLHVDSSSMRFDAPAPVQLGSSGIANVSTSVVTETDKGDGETTTASIQVSASGSPKDNDVTPSSNAVTDAATGASTSAVSKVQSKVLRSKKRMVAVAPSLRSNKKVSSLLDKWKAAKEELEDEEEPENPYEILERKREREIKEWHAQQIASGEAKENANFQPLGGDWREHVKRRRAKLSGETQPSAERSTNGNQQPDLAEISKDLPSGWQAYWDESSKQVYYGNIVTSETSWTKPTR